MRGREEGRSGVGWGFESCGDGCVLTFFFFFSSRRRHTRFDCDWSSDVCSSDLLRADDVRADHALHHLEVAHAPDRDALVELDQLLGELVELLVVARLRVHLDERQTGAFARSVEMRSEERRVGKECRSRWSPYH